MISPTLIVIDQENNCEFSYYNFDESRFLEICHEHGFDYRATLSLLDRAKQNGAHTIAIDLKTFEYGYRHKEENKAKYRRKPEIIDAILWTGSNAEDIALLTGNRVKQSGNWLIIQMDANYLPVRSNHYVIKDANGYIDTYSAEQFEKDFEIAP